MFRVVTLFAVGLVIAVGTWFIRPNEAFLRSQWLSATLEPALAEWAGAHLSPEQEVGVRIETPDAELEAAVRHAVRLPKSLHWADPAGQVKPFTVALAVEITSSTSSATLRYRLGEEAHHVRRVAWYAVLPPLLAIVTAILFRHVILSLLAGVILGGILSVWPSHASPFLGVWHACREYVWHHAIGGEFSGDILAFILLISATVGVAQQCGGIRAMILLVTRFCKTPRSARMGAAVAGVLIFFDDYLNCILVGNMMRPLTDRYRVSRAKLAYIVDSTAAPVAGLSIVSTWIAFELSQIGEGLIGTPITVQPFQIFFQSIPYRFYCWFTLAMVFTVCWLGRDFGPMRTAELKASGRGVPAPEGDASERDDPIDDLEPSGPGRPAQAIYAILPIGLTLVATMIGLWYSGLPGPNEPPIQAADGLDYLCQVLGRARSPRVFALASAGGYLLALALAFGGRALTVRQAVRASLIAVRAIIGAIFILLLAWAIGAACRDVGTATFLVAMFRDALHPLGFAMVVFLIASMISFATGTSYGTMAILLPNVVPLAWALGEQASWGSMAMVVMSVGAVLEGSIFGDHCSPISDTTILSAIASRCDVMEHVRTQMPYALLSMSVALLAGYGPVALGFSPLWAMAMGAIVTLAVVRLLGRNLPNC